jgi:hypothetical protein
VTGPLIEAGVAGRGSRAHPRPIPNSGGVEASTGLGRITVAGARGGQCTSTVAAAIAVFAAGHRPTRLVSDEPAAMAALLGVPAPLGDEPVVVADGLELGGAADDDALTVVDGGRTVSFPAVERTVSLVVVRGPCYLALRHLVNGEGRLPDGIVVAKEPGRSLTANDVADVTGVPVVAQVDVTPAVARVIDAGLLVARLHRLDELAPLRRWTTRLLAPRHVARPRSSIAALTAGKEGHRLSTCAKRK